MLLSLHYKGYHKTSLISREMGGFFPFFQEKPTKRAGICAVIAPSGSKGPAHRAPGGGRRWTPPFSGKRERAPALSLSSPSMSAQLTLGVGRLLKGIHPPFRPIACPGKAAGPGSSPQTGPKGPTNLSAPTDSPGRANPAGPGGSPQKTRRP